MFVVPQADSHGDDNLPLAGTEKKLCGANKINELLRYLHKLDQVGNCGYKQLFDISYSAHRFTRIRAEIEGNPCHNLEAAVVIIALQDDLLTAAEWENDLCYLCNAEWNTAIDDLFQQILGRLPDRSTQQRLEEEGKFLWGTIKLPYTEEQFDYLLAAWERVSGRCNNLTPAETELYYNQPLSFDALQLPPKAGQRETLPQPVAPQPSTPPSDSDDSVLLLAALFLVNRLAERVNKTEQGSKLDAEPINPEQHDADNQADIDRIAGDLLGSINWTL